MLYITLKNTDTNEVYMRSWHIGEPKPLRSYEERWIIEVQADGDELVYIRRNYSNLPLAHSLVAVRYYGDHAKFIVGNLRLIDVNAFKGG